MRENGVFELRAQQEQDFVCAALSAVNAGTMRAADVLTVCPPELLSPGVPHAVYAAMGELAASGQKPTLDRVYAQITARRAGKNPPDWPEVAAEEVAGFSVSIFGGREDAVLHYAALVRQEGLKRMAESKLMGLAGDCRRYGNDPAEIASGLTALAAEMEGGAPESCDLSGLMERVMAAVENGSAAKPLPTPWPNLNRVLKGGLAPGELAILAARPGMGKTALAVCLGVETARRGVPALFVSREVKDVTLAARMLAREGRVDARFFRQGLERALNVQPALRAAARRLSPLPLRVVEKSVTPMSPREVRRLAKTSKDVGLVIVDYLQLLNPDTKQNSREREVAEMSRAMKQLALDCNCPVLLLSQLNRKVEESERAPQLSDLRESGAIEQDADIVIFLHSRKGDAGLARMPVRAVVAKGRSSGTGSANLLFDKPFADFTEDGNADAWAEKTGRQAAAGNDL